jgi:apolipoprotein N-acyltransferase
MQAYPTIFVQTLLPFILGAISVLGFAPYYLYPVSIIALAALFYSWQSCATAKQAALTGFMYGLGLFGVGIYWIYISLHTYGNMPAVMAGISTFVLAAFLALFPAAVGALAKRLSNHKNHIFLIAVAVLWGVADWVRSWIFTGFPWLTMGYSQLPHSPLAGYIPIFGVYAVSIISVLIAGLLSSLFNKQLAQAFKRGAVIALVIIIVSGELLKRVEWTTPSGKPLSVS